MRRNTILWIVQVLLAALYLFAGGFKLFGPAAALQGPGPLSVSFLRFIGAMEVLGAIGLIIPWLTQVRPILTPLAAALLVIIMIGATVLTAASMGLVMALFPLVAGILDAGVAYSRWPRTDVKIVATARVP